MQLSHAGSDFNRAVLPYHESNLHPHDHTTLIYQKSTIHTTNSSEMNTSAHQTLPPTPPLQPTTIGTMDDTPAGVKPSRDNCDRRRPGEGETRLPTMPEMAMSQTVKPFLREHIPAIYAPVGKASGTIVSSARKDPNSKFCYRHRPDSKCRKAADESKMAVIQSVSISPMDTNRIAFFC